MSLLTARPFPGMSVFKKGRMPQPDPSTGYVNFLFDDLSDKMQASINRYLWQPGSYKCTYQPKINQLGIVGTATRFGDLYSLSWFARPEQWTLVYSRSQDETLQSDFGTTPSFLFEFYRLYAEK